MFWGWINMQFRQHLIYAISSKSYYWQREANFEISQPSLSLADFNWEFIQTNTYCYCLVSKLSYYLGNQKSNISDGAELWYWYIKITSSCLLLGFGSLVLCTAKLTIMSRTWQSLSMFSHCLLSVLIEERWDQNIVIIYIWNTHYWQHSKYTNYVLIKGSLHFFYFFSKWRLPLSRKQQNRVTPSPSL